MILKNYYIHEEPSENNDCSLSELRTEFSKHNLETLFDLYVRKIQHGYLSLFLILQTILNITHITVLVIVINMKIIDLFPDIMCYSILAVLAIVALILKETVGKPCTAFPLVVTVLTFLLLVASDMFIPLYHSSYLLRPAYSSHIIIACYVFLPINSNLQAFIFGFAVTICHFVILGFVTYKKITSSELFYDRIMSDAIYMLCINGMGIYFRFMNEILKRRTFLDRRECVKSTLYLKHEEDQEEQLMLSILPQHIASCVRDDLKKTLQNLENNVIPDFKPFKGLYIKEHKDVTILYADIVRYTEMTRKLKVIKIVETLNELFGKFDVASEQRDVLRIKFLGDCYYCVSGIPESNPNHAINCVELGLDMITIIQQVRSERNLNIDMRIGVHSGSIIGGLIGECKWQYDIWSKDVDIANRMEQKGEPGKVHISKQTLDLLYGKYRFTISNAASKDEFLKKMNIETFIITPNPEEPRASVQQSEATSIFNRRQSASVNRNYVRPVYQAGDGTTAMSHRRTAFMSHNIKNVARAINQIENKLEEAIQNMPLGKFEQWFKSPGINPFLLTFRNWNMEFPYLVLPDSMFKYYLLSSIFILFAILAIQGFTLFQLDWSVVLLFITVGVILLILIPLTWGHSVFKKILPDKKIFNFQYQLTNTFKKIEHFITNSSFVRILVYITVSGLITACAVMDLVECQDYVKEKDTFTDDRNRYFCTMPWHMTQTCALAILASFLFLRMHLGLKLMVGTAITAVFCYFISNLKQVDDSTWNIELKTQIACIINITFLTFTLHLIDRQAEYLNRLDYQWKAQLASEQKEAETMHGINTLLLQNILPIHVAQIYLDTNRQVAEPYHEEYKSVAVMFASVVDYEFYETDVDEFNMRDVSIIRLMNEIIGEFDKLLIEPCGQKIEKIKVAGWTYMAACGLDPGRKDSTTSVHRQNRENIVVQLVKFGVRMMNVLNRIRSIYHQDFKLRIGISHGEVTAGVVGSKKPLYDIWGDAVNMASRMDSTGEKGKIQVTENTAQILNKQGIKCNYRGETYLKGLEIYVPTFFVDLENSPALLDKTTVK